SLLAMGGLGLFFATILAVASQKLKVKEDPTVESISEALPGLNCGACGQAGCHDLAVKLTAQGSLDNLSCPPGGAETAESIAKILGIDAGTQIKKRAVIKCGGTKELANDRADYHGVKTCTAAELVGGGAKACSYGCLGYGDCEKICPFDAIHIGEDGLPHVIEENCTACGLCVEACPRLIIDLVPCSNRVVVACNSQDKGAVVRQACRVGCIGCMLCTKTSPEGYTVKNTLAKVNYEKGDAAADAAIIKCPTKCIVKL
ncbi:MAG: RnfABCDGE type electron transport complex subunit B, partial [Candidatus Margulisbacteria bacterium]|nr:RnfABCDGE type electron transport complex subunit B [Candidatus Margulisiibacteriota bacterium]